MGKSNKFHCFDNCRSTKNPKKKARCRPEKSAIKNVFALSIMEEEGDEDTGTD